MKHNYLLRLILLLALLYAPAALGAIYKGRVVERSTHRPLSDIAIVDKGTGRVIGITDSDGRFAIDLADKKEAHTLVFRGIGYDTQEVALASGSSVGHSLRIEMAINVSQIDEVVVTSARRERLLKNEPIVTHVFTARQIERLAAADLQDVLASFIPGVQFSQDNDNAANQTVRIQGLGGSYILFLLDGEPISSKSGESIAKPRGGNIDFSRIDIGNIERIEYLPSGGSILHGSNAIGGVVNIITKRITQPWQAQIGTRIAIPHQRRWEARAGLSNERYNMGLSLSQTKTKAYGEDKLRLPAGDALNLALRLGYALTPQLKIKADANSTRSNLYLQTTIPRRRSTHLSESFGIDSYGGRIGAQWQISDKHALDLTTSLDYSQRDIESIEVATSKRERLPDYRNSIWVARLQYNLALAPNHSTMIGLEHTQEHGQTVWLESEAGHTVRNAVAYAQHDAHFWGQKLHLSYGLRYDRHSAFGGRLTHKASVLQKLGPIESAKTGDEVKKLETDRGSKPNEEATTAYYLFYDVVPTEANIEVARGYLLVGPGPYWADNATNVPADDPYIGNVEGIIAGYEDIGLVYEQGAGGQLTITDEAKAFFAAHGAPFARRIAAGTANQEDIFLNRETSIMYRFKVETYRGKRLLSLRVSYGVLPER